MASEIIGKGKEKAMFERGEEIYWVDLLEGHVTKVSCVYRGPGGVLHGYQLIGKQYFGDCFFDGGCCGMAGPYPVKETEVPKFVKDLLLGEKEATLKKIQELNSKYTRKLQKDN